MYDAINEVIIYCRVSSQKQVTDGNGLDSQEQICRKWAKFHNKTVKNVYIEEGISGAQEKRPQLDKMLAFLDASKEHYIVLFYDISRVARDTEVFLNIYNRIAKKGHVLQTTQNNVDESPMGKFFTTLNAAQSQLFREENALRTKNNMAEHAKQGYWVLNAPVGYQRQRIEGRVCWLKREPDASYLQEALKGFASNKFLTQTDVYNFLADKQIFDCNNKQIKVTMNFVKNLLINEKYTGCFAYDKWGIPRQRWHIEQLISGECYEAIQDKLKGKKANIKPHKYNKEDEDFPLRRWVKCAVCGHLLTADKPRSKSGKRHLYYHCYNKACPMCNKNVPQAQMHSEFKDILQNITPKQGLIKLVKEMIIRAYNEQQHDFHLGQLSIKEQIEDKKEEKRSAFELLLKGGLNDGVVSMCNDKICQCDIEIKELEKKLITPEQEQESLDGAINYVFEFVGHPAQIWERGNYQQRQCVLNLCFSDKISYDKEEKFRTPQMTQIFAVFDKNLGSFEGWRAQKDSNPQPSDP